MTYASTRHGNPCIHCGDAKGNCRTHKTREMHLCTSLAGSKKGEKSQGYIVIGDDSTGRWAQLLPNKEGRSEEVARENETKRMQEQQLQQKKQQAQHKERLEKSLSPEIRHKLNSQILEQLPVNQATLEDLQKRGFTQDEINRSGFKSVAKGQILNLPIDSRLPGVGKNTKSLAIGGDGYLCPLRDFDGRIVGLQMRLHNPSDDNRYRWVSSDRQVLGLAIGDTLENPLAVFHPPSGKPEGIAIVEGTGPKPFFVSERLNLLTIGAAGGQWLSSPNLLKEYIKAAIDKYGVLPIKVIPDAGWALNSQVTQKILNLLDWLKSSFGQSATFVLDWNQIHKNQKDIDELEDLSITRTLLVDSFLKKYKEVFGEAGQGFAPKRYQNWAKSRVKLTADITQHEKWLTIPKGIQNECDILLVRKALGGGKTQGLIEFLKQLDKVSLLVGYRNSLLNNTITRANEMGLNALHIKDKVEVIQHNYVNFAADDSIKLWGGCADSFFKFNAIIDHHPEYYFVHDEICSVLGHLRGGGTLKGRQQQAINWDVNTIRNSRFCIMMDANLSDKEVDFVRLLFPEKRIKVLDSISPTNPRKFYFLETETASKDYTMLPKYLPAQLMEKAKAAKRVLWISDSQRSCEIADEILTEHGHKHFRLDGKTSHEELSKQLQSAPKQFITSEKLDSLSLSPSAESGLSIDLYGYFDVVCFDIRGTVSVNTLTQLSARLRDTNVPIYVACPEFINMTSDPCPYAIKSIGEILNQRIDMLAAKTMEVDGELVNSEFVATMFSEMRQIFAQNLWFIESLKDAKELKYEHQNLKLALKTALAQAGHRIIDLVDTPDEKQYDELQQTKETVKRREAEKVFNSQDIDWEKAQELLKKDVDYDRKCQIRKARLKHQLPGIEETPSWNTDFVYTTLVDQPQFLDKRWRLRQFQDEELSKAVFKSEKKYNFEFGFTPMDAWKSTSTKLEALKLLGVGKIIDTGVFSSQDTWVRAIVDEYYDNSDWFNLIGIPKAKRSLNSDGNPNNLQYVKKMVERFVGFFGFEVKLHNKSETNRQYRITTPSEIQDYLPDIDECFRRRTEAILEEMREVSLKGIADKAEEARRQQQGWEEKHQAELNKRVLESQLTHNESEMLAGFPSIYINQKENLPATDPQNIPSTEMEEWNQPGTIADVAQMLSDCEDQGMLAMLRQCEIPVEVFRLAGRQLPSEKREQIRQWVLEQNSA